MIEGNALSCFGKFIPLTAIYNYTFGFVLFKNMYLLDINVINSSELLSIKSIKGNQKRQETHCEERSLRQQHWFGFILREKGQLKSLKEFQDVVFVRGLRATLSIVHCDVFLFWCWFSLS